MTHIDRVKKADIVQVTIIIGLRCAGATAHHQMIAHHFEGMAEPWDR